MVSHNLEKTPAYYDKLIYKLIITIGYKQLQSLVLSCIEINVHIEFKG